MLMILMKIYHLFLWKMSRNPVLPVITVKERINPNVLRRNDKSVAMTHTLISLREIANQAHNYLLSKITYRIILFLLFSFFSTNLSAGDIKVKKIFFTGSTIYDPDELSDLLHSKENKTFDLRFIKLDKIVLTNYFREQGYLTVGIEDSLVINRDKKEVDVYYRILANQRYYFGRIEFYGNKEISSNTLKNLFKPELFEKPFNETEINAGKQRMEDLYYNNGKPMVELNLDYEFEQDSIVITKFKIRENQTVYINNIEYTGLRRVKKFLIRRELELSKGDRYNREKMDISQMNIYSTGLFDYVRFELRPVVNDSNNVILHIFVQERNPIWLGLRTGFAYEQETSYGSTLEFTAEGGHRNLFGTARSIQLQIEPSFSFDINEKKIHNTKKQYNFIYVEPWIGYTRTPGIFNVSYLELRQPNRDSLDVINLGFNIKHEFKNYLELSGGIDADFVNKLSDYTENLLYIDYLAKNQIYSINFLALRDKRNNIFNPTDGSYVDLSLALAYSIGYRRNNDKQINKYLRMTSSWKRYQPLKYNIFNKRGAVTLATRLKGGIILELGGNKKISDTDLFFAGGASSVRGYKEQLLGPVQNNKAQGGKLLLLSNAEVRIPLFWRLLGEIFIDGGNISSEINQFKPLKFKFTTGTGLALITPIGPVRLDYGYKLNRDKTDLDPGNFHLGIYFAF
jgi:outer membrane protein insertion porin family